MTETVADCLAGTMVGDLATGVHCNHRDFVFPEQVLARIRAAKDDPAVKGIVLNVRGSGMGWAKLTDFRRALVEFRESGKPAVAFAETFRQLQQEARAAGRGLWSQP